MKQIFFFLMNALILYIEREIIATFSVESFSICIYQKKNVYIYVCVYAFIYLSICF